MPPDSRECVSNQRSSFPNVTLWSSAMRINTTTLVHFGETSVLEKMTTITVKCVTNIQQEKNLILNFYCLENILHC